jgi:hypothetical protein
MMTAKGIVSVLASEAGIVALLLAALRYAYFHKYYTDEVYLLLVVATQVYVVVRGLVLSFKLVSTICWRSRGKC